MDLRPTNSATLIRAANVLIIVFVAIGMLFRWYSLGMSDPAWAGMVVLVISLCNSLYLLNNGSEKIASRVLVAVLIFGIIFSGIRAGGFEGPIVLIAPIIPVFAIILLGHFFL